jgi:hypothetical protein
LQKVVEKDKAKNRKIDSKAKTTYPGSSSDIISPMVTKIGQKRYKKTETKKRRHTQERHLKSRGHKISVEILVEGCGER